MITFKQSTRRQLQDLGPCKPCEVSNDPPPDWIIQPKLKGMSALLAPDGTVYTREFNVTTYTFINPTEHWIHGELYSADVPQWDVVGYFHRNFAHPKVKFHAFDLVTGQPQFQRLTTLVNLNCDFEIVPYTVGAAMSLAEAAKFFAEYYHIPVSELEGLIFRDPNAPYQYGPTNKVQKFKFYKELDATVTGFIEGLGKRKGMLGAFLCMTDDDKPFRCGGGRGLDDASLTKFWKDKSIKRIKVRYEILKDGVPQCPQFVEVIS